MHKLCAIVHIIGNFIFNPLVFQDCTLENTKSMPGSMSERSPALFPPPNSTNLHKVKIEIEK
jgi:hypothetical protein